MKATACLFSLLVVSGCGQAQSLIGTAIPPYPPGWKHLGGACIASRLGVEHMCDFAIGELENDGQRILYLGQAVARTDPRQARWRVSDSIAYPVTPAGYDVVYGICEQDGVVDESIVAVVQSTDSEWLYMVREAFHVDWTSGRFQSITVNGVRCRNAGWGE